MMSQFDIKNTWVYYKPFIKEKYHKSQVKMGCTLKLDNQQTVDSSRSLAQISNKIGSGYFSSWNPFDPDGTWFCLSTANT